MTAPSTVDAYLAALSDERRAGMETLRAAVNAAAPDATETIAYGMPALRSHGGQFLVSYAAFKNHYSLFPASDAVIAAGGDELARTSRAAARSSSRRSEPIPTALVTKIVEVRFGENAARAAGR